MRTHNILILGLFIVAFNNCYDDNKVGPDQPIELRTLGGANVGQLQGDGFSRITLKAHIDPDAASDRRTIRFATNHGVLIGGTTTGDTSRVTVDDNGDALVDLQSSPTPDTARVTAEVINASSVIATILVNFTPVDPRTILVCDSAALTGPADGFTLLPVSAHISPRLPADKRTVTFQSSAGTFASGTSGSDLTTATQPASSDNRALVQLQTPIAAGTGSVHVSAAGVGCDVLTSFSAVAPSDILQIVSGQIVADADNSTLTPVTVRVASRVPNASRTVRFTTTAGSFQGSTDPDGKTISIAAGQSDSVRAYLKSPIQATTGTLRAQVGSFSQDVAVSFATAQPDTILIDAGRFTMQAADSTTIVATAVRLVGSVTQGTVLRFEAFDPQGHPVGQFRSETPTNTAGQATALFKANDISVATRVTIVVSTLDRARAGSSVIVISP